MKRLALTLALFAPLAAGCQTAAYPPSAATTPPPMPTGAAAGPGEIDLARMKEDIRILASDEFKGRGPGRPRPRKETTDYIVRPR
jgi:hypothetical protein